MDRVRLGVVVATATMLASATGAMNAGSAISVRPLPATTSITIKPGVDRGQTDVSVSTKLSSPTWGTWTIYYGKSTSYGQQSSSWGFQPGTDEGGGFRPGHLEPGTTYHFQAVVRIPSNPPYTETYKSEDVTATTLPASKPTAEIADARATGACACADVTVGVSFGGLTTHVSVEYGSTPQLGTVAYSKSFQGWESEGAGPAGVGEDFLLPSEGRLKQGGTYYLRVVAVNKLGTAKSPIASFTVPTDSASS